MAEDGFTFTPDDQDELRERIRARKAQQDAFKDQRNVYVETDNPDDAAYDLKKARELGIPREAIGGLREDYRADDALLKIEKLRAEAPKTSSWLRAPDNYAVAKDDTDTLGVIENAAKFANSLIKFGTGIPKATQAAAPGFKAQALGLAQSEVQQPQTYLDQLDAYRKAQAGRRFGLRIGGMEVSALPLLDMLAGPERPDPGMQGLLLGYGRYGDEYDREITGFLSGAAQPVENVLREEITKALSEQKALAPATEDFVADSLLSGWTSFINMIPTVAAAMATRNPTLASGLMGGQVYGQEYASGIVDYKLTPQAAKERAMMHSAIEFGTERLSLGIFLDLLKRDDTGIITKLAIGMGTEQIQEQGATFGQDFVDWQTLNPDKTIEQFLAERPAAAARTALATLVASGAMQGTMIAIDETVKQLGRDATATQTSPGDKAINDILDAAGKSKLGNRSPAALKDFIDQTTAGTEIETVTVDLDGVVEALQQKGIDPTETLAALGVSDDMLAQKWEQFGEVEVRMSTLAVSPAMREHRDAVQPHVRTQNDEYTPAKKEQVAANLRADVAREAETIREAFANGIELEAQQQAVADRVRQRIRGAGILAERAQENASVAIQTAMVTTLARRIGEDPVAFFDRHYPRIQGDIDGMVSEEGALEQNAQDPKSTLPALFHGGRAGLTLDDIQIVREPGATKQGKKNRVYGGFYGTSKLEEAQGYAEATEGSTVYRIELTPDAKVETKEGDVTRLSAQTIQEYRDRGVDVVVGKDPRGRTEYVVINKDAITGLVDSGDLLAQEITMPDLENKDEVEAALNDPETDVLPLTEGMQILELDEFIAFHGTTAKFDQFKSDKIGAGEGAQAFGPGHYFTQSAGVANWYRKRMKKLSPGIKLGKESFNKANPAHFALAEYWKYRDKFLHHDLFGGYRSLASDMTHSGALERAIFSLQYEIDQIESPFLYPGRAASEYAAADRPVIRDRKELAAFLKQGLSYLKTLDPKSSKGIPKPRKPTIRGGGNIYTVAVKLPAEATIQYDKPFGQQPERVQQAFREAAEAGTLGEAADLIAKYGAATRMGPLVAALKKSDTPAMGIMRRNGVRGVRYLDGMSRGKRNPANQTFNYVVFNDGDVKVLDRKGLLFQELDQQRRGQFSPSRNIITMFEAADVTTLMHEGAHWYLAEIERMAMAENAHPFVTEQWEAVKKWGKVGPDFRMYDDMGRVTPEGRELQEAFAETFEVYLQTGKAPTDSLREAFRAFKAWITALWRDIRTGKISLPERANLSPEIAQVMDRMLAVDEEINAQAAGTITRAEQQAKELLDRGIITQKQYDKALNDLDAAREAAKEDLMARIMDAEMRVRQAQLGVEQRRIKGDVVREFDRSPVGRALSWLGYGQWKGDVPTAETREDAADFEMYQSVRTATTMPMQEVTSWVLEHTEANIQQINDDEVVVLNFTVDDTPNGAPVRMSIRLQPTGRADVNLFLNGQLADSLSGVTDRMERARVGRELFSRAIMALRQYAAETPDLKAIHFVAAESKAKGTKEKSRERLYRSMLSTLQMEGYTAYEIEQQMGLVREEDGVKSSEPRIGFTGFVLIRDGVDPNEFARNEILRGTQTGGDVGEIVTAFRATQLGGAARRAADGEGPGTRGPVGGGAVDDTLGQEARKVDTSVAGGLTEKSFIGTRELEGVTIFPMFADLTDAGSTFAALDGLPIAPTPYLGGPNFPWLSAYRDAGIVWAFNAPGVITKVRNKVKALQKQARAEGRSDRVIITMLAMKDDAHTSNEMVISALLRTLDAVVEAGRFPQEQLAEAKKLIVSKAGKKDEGYSELATFPGFDNAEALHDWSRGATFAGRKALAKEMRSAKFQQLPGMFPVERIVREAIDPDYRATQQGDALLAFEIDPDAEDLIIDFDDPRSGNIPRHPAYRYGMRGELVGSFSTHIPMEVLYGDLLPKIVNRAKEGANPKFLMERLKTADAQVVTEDIIRTAEVIEGLHDYRIAQAHTAGIAGQWRSSDVAANKGGVNPVEFERALLENEAAATLTPYTRTDVTKGKKDGSLRVFQLGEARVQDGGLNVWMAVKTGYDYRNEYPGEVTDALVEQGILTDNEVALVGVASNELGVKGMATFQVLKGIEEGVTVLDAFKVTSPSKPDGLLPTIYATLGFEEVGQISFDPKYYDAQQLADLKAIWTRQGWNEADGYPAVAIMKWRGDDAVRPEATRRFILESQAGLGIRGDADFDQLDTTAASILDGDVAGDQGDGLPGQGDGRADPRRFADRARGVSDTVRSYVENILAADARAIKALKLPQELIDRIRAEYGPALEQTPDDTLGQEAAPLFQRGDPKGWGETAPPPDLPPMRLDLEAVRQLYGEDAVRRLPKAIRDRSRDQTSIDGMLGVIRASAKTLKRKPPKTLFQFIRSRKARTVAGQTVPIKQWGIRGAADELKAMNREDLINETNGIHIDYVREGAAEAGYLAEDATINDLLNAIDKEARGEPVYSRFDQEEVEDLANAQEWADWLDSQGVDIFETDQKKLKAEVAKVVTSTNSDAATPDQAAEVLGFPTGEDLLNLLAIMGNREQWVREETERRMREEFGDPMADGTFAEEARISAEAEINLRAAEIEIEALARAVGEPAASKLAKEMAMQSLGMMTVKELGQWERFLTAERREMRNTLEAVRRGDMAQAFVHKRRQMVNMHLAKAAREKSEAIEKQRKDLLTYYTSKGRRDKIARDYIEKIEALLDGYELRVSKQGPGEQKRRLSAKEYVDQMAADGREAEVASEALLLAEMAGDKVWRDLFADEVDYLVGTVRNLAHLGRTKGRLMREQDKRRFDAVVADLVGTLLASPTARDRGRSFTPTVGEKTVSALRQFDARMTRLEFEFSALDGQENGPLWNTLFRPFAEAGDVETRMMREAAQEMKALYEAFDLNERGALFHKRVPTPELATPGNADMTIMDIVVLGLNWGNAGNRKALLDGYGWDAVAVEAVLNRVLTDKHWNFIEGTWNLIGSYRADAFALEKAITGVEPKAVEGIDFTLASGRAIKGRYYPLKYDGGQARADSVVISRLDEKQALSDLGKTFSKVMTKMGHLIERVGSGGKPVKINIGVMHEHVQNVIHDIAYRKSVIDVHRIIRDPRFADAYIQAAGRDQYDQLLPWLAAIATERNGDPGGIVTKLFQGLRRNTTVVTMGFKISTAIQQFTGPLQGMTLIGPRYVAQGFVKALASGPASFWSAWKTISAKSEFMRDRPQGFDRDIRMVTNRLQERSPLGAIQRNSMILTAIVDMFSSVVVWQGAYDRAMDGNVYGIEKGNEDDAIAWADSVVRQTQVAGRIQDLPQIMRGTETEKLITMMFSYFSGLFNFTRKQKAFLQAGRIGATEFNANMVILYVAAPLIAGLLSGRLLPDEDDEPEDIALKVGKELASNAAGTIPIFRDLMNATLNPQFGYQMSPIGSTVERLTGAASRAATGDTLESEAAVKEAVNALGILFGLPSGQLVVTGDYVYDLVMGEEDPAEDPVDAAREALLRSER